MTDINLKINDLRNAYSKAEKRLIFLDYDGTLAPIEQVPWLASPSVQIKDLLRNLSRDTLNEVVVISGRDQKILEEWLGDIPVTLAAEHGAFYKKPSEPWKSYFTLSAEWKKQMNKPLKALEAQFEGSLMEEKKFSVTWHYRNLQTPISTEELNSILLTLRSIPNKIEFVVYEESYAIELRTVGIDKGRFATLHISEKGPYDFVLAIGDGRTDEDLFQILGKENFSVKVGKTNNSHAHYYLDSQAEVIPLLNRVLDQTHEMHLKE